MITQRYTTIGENIVFEQENIYHESEDVTIVKVYNSVYWVVPKVPDYKNIGGLFFTAYITGSEMVRKGMGKRFVVTYHSENTMLSIELK